MTTPTTAAELQRYELTVEPDDSAYMELDPDGPYVLFDEAEDAIAEARAAALDEAKVAVEALHAYGTLQDEQCLDVLAAIEAAIRERSGE